SVHQITHFFKSSFFPVLFSIIEQRARKSSTPVQSTLTIGTINEWKKRNARGSGNVDKHKKDWVYAQSALESKQIDSFRMSFLHMHPYDQAQFFQAQDRDMRMAIYTYLSPDEMAEIMENIELEATERYFTEMDPRFSSSILAQMPAHDAVDILDKMDDDKFDSCLTLMDAQVAGEIKGLINDEEKTAGSIMTTELLSVYKAQPVQQVLHQLKEEAP